MENQQVQDKGEQFIADAILQYPIKDGEPYFEFSNGKKPVLSSDYLKLSVSAAATVYRYLNETQTDEMFFAAINGGKGLFGYRVHLGKTTDGLFCEIAGLKEHHDDLLYFSLFLKTSK